MRIACVGDLCMDIYSNRDNMMLVGGNSILVAAAIRNCGMNSSFVGNIGNDHVGEVALQQLNDHGIDTSCVKVMEGATAWTEIVLKNDDRIFQSEDLGVLRQFHLDNEALRYIAEHDMIHFTAFTNWPTAPTEIPNYYSMVHEHISHFHQMGIPLSVDFSDMHDEKLYEAAKDMLSVAILSRSDLTEEACMEQCRMLHSCYGFPLVIITRGDKGSLAFDGETFFVQPIVPVQVVDPLGAGDSFAGSFLTQYLQKKPIPDCLQFAAEYAAGVCTRFGGF